MGIAEFINNNSAAVTIGAVVVLVIAIGIIIMQTRDTTPPPRTQAYYYNLETGAISVDSLDLTTPSPGAEGGTIVRAHIFACGECPDTDFTGMTAEQVEQAGAVVHYVSADPPPMPGMENMPEVARQALGGGPMGRSVAPASRAADVPVEEWPAEALDAGKEITTTGQLCPQGQPPQQCHPEE